MINNVVLVGRIVRDIDLKVTKSGTPVVNNVLAVNRPVKQSNSDQVQTADFINFVVYGNQAENLSLYMKKGSLIGLTGRIQTSSYDNQQGQRVYVTEVVADRCQFLDSRSPREGQTGGSYSAPTASHVAPTNSVPDCSRDENPFGSTNPLDISDDDLPF